MPLAQIEKAFCYSRAWNTVDSACQNICTFIAHIVLVNVSLRRFRLEASYLRKKNGFTWLSASGDIVVLQCFALDAVFFTELYNNTFVSVVKYHLFLPPEPLLTGSLKVNGNISLDTEVEWNFGRD